MAEPGNFNRAVLGGLLIRAEDADHCRCRLTPREHHLNSGGNIHGGITLGLMDSSLFAALYLLRGVPASLSVTIDLQAQFIGPGSGKLPLDCVTEVLRETRRMAFLRGLVVQEEALVGSFTATVRKASVTQ
ncbi:MAG: PaaI family thioesterase [Sphingomonadales bacterium]|nr:PaaI family thioesterase [Sphingomonadales bacterium]MBU3991454.1 PaaI family thioesterase [Alphaproteobacteria bacterium]